MLGNNRLFLIFVFLAICVGTPPLFGDDDAEKELNQFFDQLPTTYSKGHADMMERIPGFGKKALPILIRRLEDKDPTARMMAAEFLGLLGADARDSKNATDSLLKALDDPDAYVQIRAAGALKDIAPESEEIFTAISRKLDDPNPRIRADVIFIVGEKNIRKLGEMLAGDSNANVRVAAAFVMERIKEEDKRREVAPLLRERLKTDDDSDVRKIAAQTLSTFYRDGHLTDRKTLDAALNATLHDRDPEVRRLAAMIFISARKKSRKELFPYFERLANAALKGRSDTEKKNARDAITLAVHYGHDGDFFTIFRRIGDSDSNPLVRGDAQRWQLGLKEHDLSSWVRKLNSSDPALQGEAAIYLENKRGVLTADEDDELRDLIKEELVKGTAKSASVCDVLCRLYENPMKWFRGEEYFSPSYRSALKSLGALFLLKGAPYCGKEINIEDVHSFMASALYGEKKEREAPCPQINPFQSLNDLLSPFLEWSPPQISYSIYGKLFSLLLLQELLSKTEDTEGKKELREKVSKIKKSLEKDIDIADDFRPKEMFGSLLASHLLTTASLAAPTSKGINFVREIINPENPLSLRYSLEFSLEPGDTAREYRDPKGSVGSVIQAHLALHQKEPENPLHREHLKKALVLYRDQFPFLMMQLKRKGAHVEPYALAPYYLYTSIPYATAAINLLLRDASAEEEKELLSTKEELKEMLLGLVQEDGLFQPDPFIPGYHNPMAGLALLPLAEEECQPAPIAKITTQYKSARDKLPLGILSQD